MSSENQTTTEDQTWWIGIDVAKLSFDAAIAAPGQSFPNTPLHKLPAETFARKHANLPEFLKWVSMHIPEHAPIGIVMEATGRYSVELSKWLTAAWQELRPAIENPYKTRHFVESLGIRNKTDRLDARALAIYGLERKPSPYVHMSPEREKLRELIRYRKDLVNQKVTEGHRAKEENTVSLINKMQARRIKELERDIKRVEEEIRNHIKKSVTLQTETALLETIDGVGPIIAATILAELGDLSRFPRARQLSAYAGISPRQIQSGSSINKQTRMSKSGNSNVRAALYLAAMNAIKKENDFARQYKALKAQGKTGKEALGVIMRKLLVLMRAIIISRKPYQPNYAQC